MFFDRVAIAPGHLAVKEQPGSETHQDNGQGDAVKGLDHRNHDQHLQQRVGEHGRDTAH